MWKGYLALPPYFGGKRKLAKRILQQVEGTTFIDCFLGGGALALLGKAQGYRVICNDIAERSVIVGKALITNSGTRLQDEDLLALFAPAEKNDGFIQRNLARYWSQRQAEFLDNAFAVALDTTDETRRALLLLVLIKLALWLRPMAAFGHTNAVKTLENTDPDQLSATLLAQLERHYAPFWPEARRLARQVNGGIFAGADGCEVHQGDVFEFLANVQGDTIYIDPPYFGSDSYERHFYPIDCVLAQRMLERRDSVFNRQDVALEATAMLFAACQHIPTWVISLGAQKVPKDKWMEIIRKYRPVEEIVHHHRYTYGGKISAEAHTRELLLVARAA